MQKMIKVLPFNVPLKLVLLTRKRKIPQIVMKIINWLFIINKGLDIMVPRRYFDSLVFSDPIISNSFSIVLMRLYRFQPSLDCPGLI